MDAIFCDSHTGMFTLEPHDESAAAQFMKFETHKSRAAYHEAGHAVLKYALGVGLTRIFLRTTIAEDENGDLGIVYHGMVTSPKLDVETQRRLHPDVLAAGVSTAAGPAAERMWCMLRGHPVRTRYGSEGDHALIDRLAAPLEKIFGRSRPAFRRLVWRRAQLALAAPVIWNGVEQLAEYLSDTCWPDNDEQVGMYEDSLSGREARAFLKKLGIKPHMEMPRTLGSLPKASRE
jgi:hypothetical protein